MDAREPGTIEALLGESRWLRGLARSLVRDAERAEDAVQDTFVAALEHPRAAPRSLRGWLAAVLHNELRQERRGRMRRESREARATGARAELPDDEVPADEVPADEVAERLEIHALVFAAVRALEEPYRTAIVLRFFDELPPREIARKLAVPVKTVNTRLERALAKLRARLDRSVGGTRRRWLQALLPLAPGPSTGPWLPEGIVPEGFVMGTKAKVAVSALALAGLGWLGRAVLVEPGGREGHWTPPEFELAPAESPQAMELAPVPDGARGPEAGSERQPVLAQPAGAAAPARPPNSGDGAELVIRVEKEGSAAPVAQAEVAVQIVTGTTEAGGRTESVSTTSTGDSGSVSVEVPAGKRLWITAEGPDDSRGGSPGPLDPMRRATAEVEPLAAGDTRRVTIRLPHGLDLVFYGQVVAAEDLRPLSDARVVRVPSADGVEPVCADAAGFFEVPYASWIPNAVEVRCPGYGAEAVELERFDQTRAQPHVVALERAAAIEARVRDPRATTDSATVLTLAARGRFYASSVALDASGAGLLEDLPASVPLGLELRAGDELVWRGTEPWTLLPGERRALELDLEGGTFLYGTLLDPAGAPLAEHEIWALAAEEREVEPALDGDARLFDSDEKGTLVARSDASGRYEFSRLAPGHWWIGPAPRDGIAGRAVGIELRPGELSRFLELEALGGLAIRGRVLGPEGKPFAYAVVKAQREGERGQVTAYAFNEGRFELGPLAPGEYELRAFADGAFGWGRGVRVMAGDLDVELRLGERDSISGRVVDGAGRPADAHVHLLRRSGSLGQGTSEHEQGAFLFIDLEAGSYTVQAEGPDGRVALQAVELVEGARLTGVVLVLEEGARIKIQHDLQRSVRCSIWSRGVLAADATVHVGEESLEVVPAGPVRVELYEGSTVLAVQEFEARAGRVETVEFDL